MNYVNNKQFQNIAWTTRQRIHNPTHRKAAYKTIKTRRPKPEADVDHSITGGAANLV
jgi:hypothetical protein